MKRGNNLYWAYTDGSTKSIYTMSNNQLLNILQEVRNRTLHDEMWRKDGISGAEWDSQLTKEEVYRMANGLMKNITDERVPGAPDIEMRRPLRSSNYTWSDPYLNIKRKLHDITLRSLLDILKYLEQTPMDMKNGNIPHSEWHNQIKKELYYRRYIKDERIVPRGLKQKITINQSGNIMDMKTNFINFLKETNNYDKFCANILKQKRISIEKLFKYTDDMRVIVDRSMNWHITPEQGHYWREVHSAWKIVYDEGKEFTNRCESIW